MASCKGHYGPMSLRRQVQSAIPEDMTALSLAVVKRNLPAVCSLLHANNRCDIPSRQFDEQKRVWRWETPLVTAARCGFLEVVIALVEGGAALDITDQSVGKSPLHWACARRHTEVAKYLVLRGARIDKTDFYNEPPLVEAIGSHNGELVQLLIERGVELNTQINYDSDTPLTFSLYSHEIQFAKLLIQAGATPQWKNRDGEDALTVILTSNMSLHIIHDVVQMLSAVGARVETRHMHMVQALEAQDIVNTLLATEHGPTSLTRLCRMAIRARLLTLTGGKQILHRIDHLPIPKWMQDYLKVIHV